MKTTPIRVVLASLAFVLVHAIASGQESRGSITGLVLDSTNAPVPNAKIIATNIATRVAASTTTNSTGNYSIPYLNPGVYAVSAETAGFGIQLRKDIALSVGDRLGVDFTLQPASLQSSVQVTSSTSALQTESANVSTVIDRRRIADLPLADGNAFMLANLSAGVLFTDEVMNSTRPFDTGSVSGIRTEGAPGGNTFTLDGAPNTSSSRGGGQNGAAVAFVPPADAVEEFKVETASFDAQHGHSPGASINVGLKSGTNQLHGSAYEFYRPSGLLAQEFYAKRKGAAPQDFTYHRFGGTVGGPIVIPKVYDGRNKTFFFASYENLMNERPSNSLYTIPTLKERAGDFSALSSLIYDPASGVKEGSRIRRQPFAGNVIPTDRLNPIALNYLKYYPEPNLPGLATGENNYQANNSTSDTYDSELARVDHVFNDKHRSFVHGYRTLRSQVIGAPGWAGTQFGINPSSTALTRENLSISADHVYIVSASSVLDMKGGIARWSDGTGPVAPGFDQSTLGFPSSTLSQFRGESYFPAFSITGFQGLGASPGKFTGDTNIFFAPTFTTIRGRHSLRLGYDIRAYRENGIAAQSPWGTYSFGSTYTQGPLDNSAAQFGQSLASLALGLPTGGQVDRSASYAAQTLYQALFLQDDFKVSSRLTLNLGLRFEWETPTTERYNRNIRGFDTGAVSPIDAAVRAAYAAKPDAPGIAPGDLRVLGGLTFADGANRSFWQTDRNNLQPRVGLAYQITPKTVLRGGFGMYMVPWIVSGIQQAGFSQSTSVTTTVDSGLTFIGNIANPFPRGITEPVGSAAGLSTFIGQAIAAYAPLQRKNGMAQRWEIGLQRELPGKWIVEASYAGTRGYDLAVPINLNAIPAQYLSTTNTRNQAVIDYLGALVANPFLNIAPSNTTLGSSSTVARSTLLQPFPQFTTITTERSDGNSMYHGGEVRVDRRFQNGFTIAMGYTYSKLRERISLLNATDANPEDRVAADDRPQRFTLSGIYELPFGRGRHWGGHWNPGVDAVIGGWQIGGLYMVQTGRPLAIPNVYFNGDITKVHTTFDNQTIDSPVFDTSGFYFQDAAVMTNGVIDPTKQQKDSRISLASNIRTLPSLLSSFRGPTTMNLDVSIIKTITVTERFRVQLRGEVLNATNYIQFGEPALTPTSATFGLVSRTRNPTRQIQFAVRLTF